MRPHSLSIRGLHSFREKQVIDFDALTEAGMFGIFGPTGSGKSSILDALTLALYGKIERAGSSIQGIVHQMEKQMEVNFTFSIGRASDQKTYLVERLYQVQASGNVQLHTCRLFGLEKAEDGHVGKLPLAEGRTAVDAQVQHILGLSMHDFTRAVVLPQGKFAEFLQLKGRERNEMTERLFGLERFGRNLFDLTRVHLGEEQNTLAQHQAAQAELADATAEAVAVAQKERVDARTTFDLCDVAYREACVAYEKAREQWQLQTDYAQARRQAEKHETMEKSIDELRATLENSRRAETIWPQVEAQSATRQRQDEEAKRFADGELHERSARQQRDVLGHALEEARLKRLADEPECLKQLGALEAGRIKEEERESEVNRLALLQNLRAHALQEAGDVRAQVQVQDEAWQRDRERAKACDAQELAHHVTRERRIAVERADRAFERWSATSAALMDAIEQRERGQAYAALAETEYEKEERARQKVLLEVEALLRRLNALQENLAEEIDEREIELWIASLRMNGEQLRDAEERFGEAQKRVRLLEEQRIQVVTVEECTAREAERARALYEEAQIESTQSAHADRRAVFSQAAQTLCAGEPCPVCGSLHHPQLATSDELRRGDDEHARWTAARTSELAARAAYERTRDTHDQARLAMNTVAAEIKLAAAHEADCARGWEEAWRRLTTCFEDGRSNAHFHQDLLRAFAGGIKKRAIDFFRDYETLVGIYEGMCEKRVHTQKDLRDLQAVRETHQEALRQFATRLATLQERRSLAKTRVEELSLRQAEAEREQADAAKQWEFSVQSFDVHVTQDVAMTAEWMERLRKRLLDDEQRSEKARLEAAELRAGNEARQVTLDALRKELALREAACESATSEGVGVAQRVAKLERELIELTGGIPIAEKIGEVNALLAALREQEEATLHRFTAASEAAQEAQRAREALAVRLSLAKDDARRASSALAEGLRDIGFCDEEQVRQARRTPRERAAWEAEIRTFEDERLRLRSIVAELAAQMGKTIVSEQAWQEICSARDEAQTRFENARQMRIEKEIQERDTLVRHQRFAELDALRKEAQARVQQLESLKALLTGNRFVEYMAREQMKQVAAVATQRLSVLTRGRYGLELEGDGSFVMRDDHHGGMRRAVSTLSGGETFLTSLALALSLSAQIQLRGRHPLEFFFLDEGFGTLDQERLDTVISALERLHMDEMFIGLISHVPELRDRMVRRLIVTPAEPAGRGTRVTLERA